MSNFRHFLEEKNGVTVIEYAVIIRLIVLDVAGTVSTLGISGS